MRNPEEESQLLSTILAQMAEGVIVADPEGRFQFFNAQAEQLLGSRPSLKPEEWSEHFGTHVLDSKGIPRPARFDEVPMYRALQGLSVDNEEFLVHRPGDGSKIWLCISSRPLKDSQGRSFGAVSVCRDITALKQAGAREERLNRDFKRVIEASRDGIGIHRSGHWVFANSALTKLLGYSEERALVGVSLAETVADPDSVSSLHCDADASLGPAREILLSRIGKERVAVEVCPTPLAEFEGDAAVLVVFRDLSERKRMDREHGPECCPPR